MGYNTAVVILNDHLSDIEKDPAFGKKLSDEQREAFSRRPGYRGWQNSFAVLPSEHADTDQLVVVGGNMIRRAKDLKPAEAERILRELAFDLGFNVSRKRRLPIPPNQD